MSQENVEIIRSALDAYNRRDWAAILKYGTPDFKFDFSRAVGPLHGVFGRDEMPRLWTEFTEPWEFSRYEVDELIESGEQVVAMLIHRLGGRDGIEVEARPCFVWTFRDGKITHCSFYQERQEALEAAGISE